MARRGDALIATSLGESFEGELVEWRPSGGGEGEGFVH